MTSAATRRVFVSLGSNLGDRAGHLRAAREALGALPATRVVAASRVYETAPLEVVDQPSFLNQVLCLETGLEPLDLLRECQRIEADHGRRREVRFGPRTLDVDILLFEGVECDSRELTLPHPRMMKRAFVLVPLQDVWEWARGMPALDLAALAAAARRTQAVRVVGETDVATREAEGSR